MNMTKREKAAQFVDEGYNINVTGRNVLVTEAMKNYAMDKVSKIERFSHRIIDVSITMDIQRHEHRVDIMLKVDHIKIRSHAVSEDIYASIDKAVDKIQTQLRRYKTKIQSHQAKGLAVIDMNVNVLRPAREEELSDLNYDIDSENERRLLDKYQPHRIVSQETLPLKTLTYDEALMKLELSEDAFLVFRSEEDRKLRIMYRRNDGNFGVIEPE